MGLTTFTKRRTRRPLVVLVISALVVALTAIGNNEAMADTAPTPPTMPTVSADALPTAQINGVVYAQVVVGSRVYATGEFTSARPAGSPKGTNETPRSNILAYDLTTGVLISSWSPTLNAKGLGIAASADGSKIYVTGDFTQVSGINRYRMVALDATTGAVSTSFAPVLNARTRALSVLGNTVYVGGIFTTANGQARSRIAAFDATTGALLPWAPTADAEVMTILAPSGSGKVIAGGRFDYVSGTEVKGLAAFNATDASLVPWTTTKPDGSTSSTYGIFPEYGQNSAIYSLTTDGTRLIVTAYDYGGGGGFENSASIILNTGQVEWVNGCKGDTYSSAVMNGVVYETGHAHDCGMIGGNPQTDPRTYQYAMAETVAVASDGRVNTYQAYAGWRGPELLHWLPTFVPGSYTGLTQAAWSIATDPASGYVVVGGEFPTVNGVAQQGLTRFKTNSLNKEGPQNIFDAKPTLTQLGSSAVRVSWKAAWDRDNRTLTYDVLRGPSSSPTVVASLKADSAWWNRPQLTAVDSSAAAGSTQSYRIRATDPFGNTKTSDPTSITLAASSSGSSSTTAPSPYGNAVRADAPLDYWRLDESSGTVGYDWTGSSDLTLDGSAQRGTPGALAEPDTATTFPGTAAVPATTTGTATAGPNVFSVEAWIKTTTTSGGKIVGFGDSSSGTSGSYDRHLYMTNDGHVVFGVYPGFTSILQSNGTLNDGRWHQLVGTLSPAGQSLYVDGAPAASRTDVTTAQSYAGYWRIGGDNLNSWQNQPSSNDFAGAVDEVAVYPSALSASRVQAHWAAATQVAVNAPPTAAFTSTATGLAASFDGSTSKDTDGTVASYAWNYGDATTGTGVTSQHTYTAAGTYQVTLTVTDDKGATGSVTNTVTITPANVAPTAAFTSTSSALTASFDATASKDTDGTVASYAWNYGDATTGTGVTSQHTYTAAGTYQVTLTVTDNAGGTGTVTQPITVGAAPPPAATPYASDAFGRTVASGFGTADSGGAWTVTGGASGFSVGGGVGRIQDAAGATRGATLPVARTDTRLRLSVALDKVQTGGGSYVRVLGRVIDASNDYRLRLRYTSNGAVTAQLARNVGGTETTIGPAVAVPGATGAAGEALRVTFITSGSGTTTLQAKVWRTVDAEPAAWLLTGSDSTAALQSPGGVGITFYLSASATNGPLVASLDDLLADSATTNP